MLKIEQDSDSCVTSLRLSGRIESDRINCVRTAISACSTRKILDLSDVTLVDVEGVRFLIGCEDEGIGLAQCPLWIREWMTRERSEGGLLTI